MFIETFIRRRFIISQTLSTHAVTTLKCGERAYNTSAHLIRLANFKA